MGNNDQIEAIETVWIPMPDGAKLAARVWLPPDARITPVPAVLEYIPYRRRDRTRIRDESMHPFFAAAGYASLRVDMRGTGDSDGLMEDEYTLQEIQDGKDVIAWIADQEWSDGSVGMFGKSWGAFTSFQVAALKPPALKAIAPVMGTDDRWLEDIHFYGGVLANDNFWWGSVMQLYNALPPDPEIVGRDRWKDMWKNRLDAMEFWPAKWLNHQTHDETWRRGSISENYDDVEVPVYFFGGWADHYRDTPFRIAQKLKGPVKILMGPWAHLYPHEALPEPKIDFVSEIIRFWNHWLKGEDTGLMDEPRLRFWINERVCPSGSYMERPGRWVEENEWPSPNVEVREMWLGSNSMGEKPNQKTELTISSPQTFGSAGGEMCSFAIPGDMPTDCRVDAGGALQFRTEPLPEPLEILGQPSVSLRVSVDKPQAFVVALLVDEAKDGSQLLISRGYCNLMHRESDMNPVPANPGVEESIVIPLHGIGYRVPKGNKLVLQIATTYWPILWPSPEPVSLTVYVGESELKLPIRVEKAGSKKPRMLPAPASTGKSPNLTGIKEGKLIREIITDQISGLQMHRTFIDGGVFGPEGQRRLDETGTVFGDISERIYSISPNDQLKARATMKQESVMERGDWKVRIETYSEQTATKEDFEITASVKCWDSDDLFHESQWKHKIPRNGM